MNILWRLYKLQSTLRTKIRTINIQLKPKSIKECKNKCLERNSATFFKIKNKKTLKNKWQIDENVNNES